MRASAAQAVRVATAVALLGLTAASPPDAAAQEAPRSQTQRIVLTGTVTEAGGGPVGDALVRVTGPDRTREAATDEGGSYRVEVPAGGPWVIRVERLGYAPLRVEVRELPPEARLDFVLALAPLRLAALEVDARTSTPALALLYGTGEAPRQETATNVVMRDRAPPLAAALLPEVGPQGAGAGEAGEPGSPALTVEGGFGLRGSAGRPVASYLGGAPLRIVGDPSPLADPFAPALRPLRVWDAGAPARVTGGLEYVLEIGEPTVVGEPATAYEGQLDMLRARGTVLREGSRSALTAEVISTMPWAAALTGADEGSSRSADVHVRAAPGARLRIGAGASWRRLALALGAGPPGPRLDESTASVDGGLTLAGGLLEVRAGAGGFSSTLPGGQPQGVADRRLERNGVAARLSYARAVGSQAALEAGTDLLRNRWVGLASGSDPAAAPALNATVIGGWLEGAWMPGRRVALRAGTRIDRLSGGRPLLSPRLFLQWSPTTRLALELQAGTHRQALPSIEEDGVMTPAVAPVLESVMASGRHTAAAVRWAGPGWDLRADVYRKTLAGLPGTPEAHRVLGSSFALSAVPHPRLRAGLTAAAERRSHGRRVTWSPVARADLEGTLPWSLEGRARAAFGRDAGATGVGALAPDTLGGPALQGIADLAHAASVGLDLEVSRRWASRGRAIRPYLQLVNALGRRGRALYRIDHGRAAPWEPRLLVLGVHVQRLTPSTRSPRPGS